MLQIVASCHCIAIQFQEKLKNQTWKNRKKQFWARFWPLWPKFGPLNFFMDFTLTLMLHPTFAGYCYYGIQQFDWTQSRDIKEKCAEWREKILTTCQHWTYSSIYTKGRNYFCNFKTKHKNWMTQTWQHLSRFGKCYKNCAKMRVFRQTSSAVVLFRLPSSVFNNVVWSFFSLQFF